MDDSIQTAGRHDTNPLLSLLNPGKCCADKGPDAVLLFDQHAFAATAIVEGHLRASARLIFISDQHNAPDRKPPAWSRVQQVRMYEKGGKEFGRKRLC